MPNFIFSDIEKITLPEGEVVKITNKSTGDMIWEEAKKYNIVKDGTVIDQITMKQFLSKIRNSTVISDYGWGSQIIIPYTDAVNDTEYELPFNFGTVQTFTKEDGTTFTGLGLIAEYSIPIGDGIQFDAPEPNNSNRRRQSIGNNRWQYSNLRQWLNKLGKNWYTAQHSADAAPTYPDPITSTGFLSCFPEDFVDTVIPVKNVTKCCTTPDGGVLDITYDKFFPLSMSQMNCKCTDTKIALNDETEGRYWEYWRNKQGVTGYWSGSSRNDGGLSSNNVRIVYDIENHTSTHSCWLRSANLGSPDSAWSIYTSGMIGEYDVNYNLRVAPACVIG